MFEEEIAEIVAIIRKSGISIYDLNLEAAYVDYFENQSIDVFDRLLPHIAPIRYVQKIEDERIRPFVETFIQLFHKLVNNVSASQLELPHVVLDGYNCMPRLKSTRDTESFYYVRDKIREAFSSFHNFIRQSADLPHELRPYFNDKRGLISVTDYRRVGQWYVNPANDYAVFPSGLTTELRQTFDNILEKGDVQLSVNISEFIPASEALGAEPTMEAYQYGPVFSHDQFRTLLSSSSGVYKYSDSDNPKVRCFQRLWTPLYELQYWLYRNANSKVVEMLVEELIDPDWNDNVNVNNFIVRMNGSDYVRNRMIHGRYNTIADEFEHLDYEWLYYPLDVYRSERLDKQLHDGIVKAEKQKLFSLDGGLSFEDAGRVMGLALDCAMNPEVKKMLSGDISGR